MKDYKELTDEESQIVLGSLLGNGSLIDGEKHPPSTSFITRQRPDRTSYLKWLEQKLEKFGARYLRQDTYNSSLGRVHTEGVVITEPNRFFGSLTKKWYGKGKKEIPLGAVEELEPLGLAVLLMDKGHYRNSEVIISGFCKKDGKFLADLISKKFKLGATFVSSGMVDESDCISIPVTKKLISIVKPYLQETNSLYIIGAQPLSVAYVTKEVSIDTAHFLEGYKGECCFQHGHRLIVRVTVRGTVSPDTGMVTDFGQLKAILDQEVVKKFDHRVMNNVTPELSWRATCELFTLYLWKTLIKFVPNLYEIQVYETPTSCVTYRGEVEIPNESIR